VFHLHEEDDQKRASEHVLEVQTLRALVLHILTSFSGSNDPWLKDLFEKDTLQQRNIDIYCEEEK
jgi:hypothetical protein